TPGTITIVKQAINGDGTTTFDFSAGGPPLSDFQLTPPVGIDATQVFTNVPPGSYSVSETAVPGWSTSVSCVDPTGDTNTGARSADITVGVGENITCTFVNQRQPQTPRVIIEKEAVNGDGTTPFQFAASNGAVTLPFTLTPPSNGVVSQTFNIPNGVYTVSETPVPGWTTTVVCTDPSGNSGPVAGSNPPTATISLSNETVTCRFTNTKVANPLGTIIIEKEVVNGPGGTVFQFSGSAPIGNFSLAPPAASTTSQTFTNIAAGTYTVTETLLPNWTTDVSCTDPSGDSVRNDTTGPAAQIAVASGEIVTCRFTNAFDP
ncbi:unnamed protein product, partial [Phaeothamnion confervicola]